MSELRISILEILEQDSRTTPHEMAMQLGTTEKSVRDEIAAMEQRGDYPKIQYHHQQRKSGSR